MMLTDRLSVAREFYMRVVKTAEERKNEILDVAEMLFSTKGFDATSTNDIINEIGIARGTLYHHFKSKEDILDSMIERMTVGLIAKSKAIVNDESIPLLDRLTMSIMALNVDSSIGHEVMAQVHKPQNALLHQKMQERLIGGVVPLIGQLIEEGVEEGVFTTQHPYEAAEMLMIYSNIAFDDLAELSGEEMMKKAFAFIYHAERVIGASEGSLQQAIMKIFMK